MLHSINGCARDNDSYIEIQSTNKVSARCHVVGVTLGDRGVSSISPTARDWAQLGIPPPRDNELNHVSSSRAYIRDAPIGSRHSAVLLCIERLTMAEMTDQELNDHMDDYERVSISQKDNEV